MLKVTSEHAFETYLEEILFEQSGWHKLPVAGWDKANAYFPAEVLDFIQRTQGPLWQQMQKLHGAELEPKLLDTLLKELDLKGTLHVLRHGFKFYGKLFKLAYFKPAHGLNLEVLKLYAENHLSVTRQVPCHPNDGSTMDLTFSLNGLPVATCELKNPGSNQTCRDAVKQYKTDRDPRAPLFSYQKRALVHFAADVDEVKMATKLNWGKTFFLPFNRGSHPGEKQCGKGNPQHASGYRTGYFWQEVLQRDSFLDILGHFIYVEHIEEQVNEAGGTSHMVKKETVIFPRYHQLDAVRKLIAAARNEGAGHNYLVQHSAGSGKTNSISWLAHRLASLHNAKDEKVYDCVVVITDRKVLDQQLQDAIYQIEHAQGVVKAIDESSRQLAEAMVDGTAIVITTLQKFPFVLRGVLNVAAGGSYEGLSDAEKNMAAEQAAVYQTKIAQRRYAIIVDEAHSSQSGESARELKAILGAGIDTGEEGNDVSSVDVLQKVMESRGKQKNLSFFAFTATPKPKTLQLFGRNGADGKPVAFHTYSMRQAIEENFIKDVLRNYTTYSTYYKLVKRIEDDPKLPKKRAVKYLGKFMNLHPHNIEQKTEVMVEHFRLHVKHLLDGKAKAMVVCGSRLHAVRYKEAFERYIKAHGYTDIKPLAAFSGTVKDPDNGLEYTEPGMNVDVATGKHIGESALPARFDSPDYNVLLVANKYQTGFDQPKLNTMYVDKRLDGVQAVQTLSRLNRTYPGKEEPFVLVFVNDAEDIYAAFKPYYDATSLQETSDPAQLEALKHELDSMQVYHKSEVEAFAAIFYQPKTRHKAADHARLEKHVQPAVDRYRALENDDLRQAFRDKLRGYISLYSFLSQVMPWADADLERLYSFARFLHPHLPNDRDSKPIHPEEDVSLRYYRLSRLGTTAIDLKTGDLMPIGGPLDVGTGKPQDEEAPLSTIVDVLNERFSTEFTEADQLFFDQIRAEAAVDDRVIDTALANPEDKFLLGIREIMDQLMVQRMGKNDAIVTKYLDDKAFKELALSLMGRALYKQIIEQARS
ncbi:MAG: DEAD/DEAH box helicase family protein [Flavobacteriales bacterium]